MKTALTALFLIVSLSNAMSQSSVFRFAGTYSDQKVPDELKKGNITVGINGLGNYRNTMVDRKSTWSLTAQSGYMVANRLVIGVQASLANDFIKSKGNSNPAFAGNFRYYSFAPEFYSRYYFTSYRVKPFLQLSAGYNYQWGDQYEASRQVQVSAGNYIAAGALGISFLLNKNVALETMYNHRFIGKSTFEDPNSLLKIRIGATISIFR